MEGPTTENAHISMRRFHEQVAVITGGASGIGLAVCERLGKEGAIVIIFDLNQDALKRAANELVAMGITSVSYHEVDVADEECVKRAFDEVNAAHGRLDVLVNCAGIVGEGSLFVLFCTPTLGIS